MIWPDTHEVVISRTLKPYSLRIEVWPAGQDIEIGMKLEDFIISAIKEMGSPIRLLTKAQLQAALLKASERVCEKMKADIIQIYHPKE